MTTSGADSWPVWDPSPGFGQPLLADPSAIVLYPFTWLNLLLRPWTYYTVFVASHSLLAATGVYALARRWQACPAVLAAALAGLALAPRHGSRGGRRPK